MVAKLLVFLFSLLLVPCVLAAIHGATPPTCPACNPPTTAPTTLLFSGDYEGCHTDNMNGIRDLPVQILQSSSLTVLSCIEACGSNGYQYAAMQYSTFCFCGNAYATRPDAFLVDDGQCSMPCGGNANQMCGAGNRNSVYRVRTHPFVGCYGDGPARDMTVYAGTDFSSIEQCSRTCLAQGYKYSAMQYGTHCFCDNRFGSYGVSAYCNMGCNTNAPGPATCGGGWANAVYTTKWNLHDAYLGCWRDMAARDMSLYIQAGGPLTVQSCSLACFNAGYKFAGMQYGEHCFCGNSYGQYGQIADSACGMPCSSNAGQTCGGPGANQVYDVRNYS